MCIDRADLVLVTSSTPTMCRTRTASMGAGGRHHTMTRMCEEVRAWHMTGPLYGVPVESNRENRQ
jgi:hypothetical protein